MLEGARLCHCRTNQLHEHIVYPYVHSFSNQLSDANLLRPVTIPDILPSDLPEGTDFSLIAGVFYFPDITS